MVFNKLITTGKQLLGYSSKTIETDKSTLTNTFLIKPDTYSLSFNHFVDSNFFILFIKMIKICQLLQDGKIKRINFAQSAQVTDVITEINIDILQSIILTHAIGYLITWNFFSVREQVTADELRQRYAQHIYKEGTTVNIHKTILDNLKTMRPETDILGLIELIYISFPVRRRDTELEQIKSELNSILEKFGLSASFQFTTAFFTNFDENYKNGLEKYPHCFDNILYHFILDPNTPPLPSPSFLKGGAGYEEEQEKICCFDVNEFKNINIKSYIEYFCKGASRDYVKCEKEALANANDYVAKINSVVLRKVKAIQPEIKGGSGLSLSSSLRPVPTLASSSNLSNNPVVNLRPIYEPYELPTEIQLMDRPGSRQEWEQYFNFDGDTAWGATKQFFGFGTPGSTLPAGEGIAVAEATAGGLGLVGSGIAGIASSAVPLETYFGTTTLAGTLNSAQISAIANSAFASNIVQGMALRSGEIIVSGTVTQVTGYMTAGSTTPAVAAGTTTLGTVAATAGVAIVVAGTVYSIYGISNIQSTNIKTKEERLREIVYADIAWQKALRDYETTINEAKLADFTTTQEAEKEFKSTLEGISGLQNQQSETTDEITGKVSRTTFNQEFTPQSVDRDLQTQRNEAEKAAKAEIYKKISQQEETLIKIETDIGKLVSETSEFEENNINIRNDILKTGLKVPGDQSTFISDYGIDIALGSIAFVTLLTMVTTYFRQKKPVVVKNNFLMNPYAKKQNKDPYAGLVESAKRHFENQLEEKRNSEKTNPQNTSAPVSTPISVINPQSLTRGGRKTSKKHKKNTRKHKKNIKNTKKCKRFNSTRKR